MRWFIEEEIRGNGNYARFERMKGLKEGGGIEIENLQVLSIYAMHALSFAFCVLLLTDFVNATCIIH